MSSRIILSDCSDEDNLLSHGKISMSLMISTIGTEISSNNRIVIKFPFKKKACQVYEGGCCRQVSTVVSLVVW